MDERRNDMMQYEQLNRYSLALYDSIQFFENVEDKKYDSVIKVLTEAHEAVTNEKLRILDRIS